jgi:uncharacterized membrane protein YhdT
MPSLEQKERNTRWTVGITGLFLLLFMVGQATLYPLVLKYNYTEFPTNWYIFVLTCTIITLFVGIYLCVRVVRNTFSDTDFI